LFFTKSLLLTLTLSKGVYLPHFLN
jgi:hypothetical protein